MKSCKGFVFAILIAIACQAQQAKPANDLCQPNPQALTAVRNEIQRAYGNWTEAEKRKDAEAAAALYDADAIVLPPRGELVRGQAAIMQYYQHLNFRPMRLIEATFTTIDLQVCGAVAVELSDSWGKAEVPNLGAVPFHRRGSVTWRQQDDGSWKIYRQVWEDLPAVGS